MLPNNRKPMNRGSGFKRPEKPERKPMTLTPIRQLVPQSAKLPVQTAKGVYVRDEDYRRYVASLPCWRCGIEDYSNACHADAGPNGGKAMGLKACDLTCFPGCVDRPGINGCHSIIGNNTRMSRADKHETERVAAEKTQATLIEMSAGDAKLRKVLERVGLI